MGRRADKGWSRKGMQKNIYRRGRRETHEVLILNVYTCLQDECRHLQQRLRETEQKLKEKNKAGRKEQ